MKHHKLSILLMIAVVLICFCQIARGDGLAVTTTADTAIVKPGQSVSLATTLKNMLTPRPSVVSTLVATIDWTDSVGIAQTNQATTDLTIKYDPRIYNLKNYRVSIPSLFSFVAGSASVNGEPVIASPAAGVLTIPIGKTLAEGEQAVLTYEVKPF